MRMPPGCMTRLKASKSSHSDISTTHTTMMNNSKYRVSDEEIIYAIDILNDCIDKKCLGQGDGDAVIALIKRIAYCDCDMRDHVESNKAISKAIKEGYVDA